MRFGPFATLGSARAGPYPFYAVGDIHGCLDLLNGVLVEIHHDLDKLDLPGATVVLLGDVIDRGPDSAGVLRRIVEWNEPRLDLVVLRGNHEDAISDFLRNPSRQGLSWVTSQCLQTLASFGLTIEDVDLLAPTRLARRLAAAMTPGIVSLLQGLPVHYDAGQVRFSHAGGRSGLVRFRNDRDFVWGRNGLPRGPSRRLQVHGHFPVDEPTVSGSFVCLDTVAWRTGRLSCLRLSGAGHVFLQHPVPKTPRGP